MAFKKIDKEFLITDNSVNVYGFRLLTEGYLADKFKANPIGYRMHKREDGVVVRWEDFRQEGDKLYAKPVINLANPLGQQIADEVENGFLNAASMGAIVVLEYSESPDLMLDGQTGPTITKWYNKELSLVDVPGNSNATVQLFDANDAEINLADFIQSTLKKLPINLQSSFHLNQQNNIMKKHIISLLAVAGVLNLSDDTSDEVVLGHVRDLVDKANKVDKLNQDLTTATQEKEKAVQDLADFQKAENVAKCKAITDVAVQEGKLTVAIATDLCDKYANSPDALKNLVDGLPGYKTVTSQIGGAGVQNLADMTWDALDKAGKLPELKEKDISLFSAKFKEEFGIDYKG